ncbi:BlaI/MecI/CopY family transcriptional regulator [Anoxybacteroides tepidamans]|uniref:BlaI/MecI/CopY family transcriptional regulator n=1 Tax=Anoxybacteroides tepidamans TaxID=265948 RepID=UPI0005589310|nr:BlaI/MecI/CopY family transcriptional regulator [Anoxybacillus tepidamans]
MTKINHFKINEEGLERFFGALEAKIMNYIWASGEVTAKDVQQHISLEKPISANAVMTVMNRLVDKGHLHKETRGRISYFTAVQTKEQFLSEQTKSVTYGLIEEFGGLAVAHMVDAIRDLDPSLLQKLEEKLNEAKRRNRS